MAARDREHDKWIPWYVDDSPGWLELTLAARGAMEGIARKLNDKTGKLHLRRGLPSLAILLHVTWAELEPAIAELIAKGKVEWDGSTFTLFDPDYIERKRRNSADRMAEKRARDREGVTRVTSPASLPSPASHSDSVTGVTPVLVLSDLVSSGSGSPSDADVLEAPPAWWAAAVASVEMTTGEAIDAGTVWLRYAGHRSGKGKRPTARDAQYWIAGVVVPELKKAREEAHHRGERDAKRDDEYRKAKDGPKVPDAAPLIRERDEWERDAGPPDPATAERMRKLFGGGPALGKVG